MSLTEIRSRFTASLTKAGRDEHSAKLIAISKVQPLERVRAVLEQGHRIFGENRVQEADSKWPAFREDFNNIELHLVGPLQTNKLNRALELFDAIHSIDRDSLAKKLANAVQKRGTCPTLFVQVNTGREPQKAGIDPDDLDSFLNSCRTTFDLPIEGLMVIPPADQNPAVHFRSLREMADRNGLSGLSMGMSGDFEEAINEGATHIRVGSAIFGQRVAPG